MRGTVDRRGRYSKRPVYSRSLLDSERRDLHTGSWRHDMSNMKKFVEHITPLRHARLHVMAEIEHLALVEGITLTKATRIYVADRNNFNSLISAIGGRWRGRGFKSRTVLGWRDKAKLMLVQKFPDIRQDQLELIQAYLPPKKRVSGSTRTEKIRTFAEKGFAVSEIAEMLECSEKTVRRHVPARRPVGRPKGAAWEQEARDLLAEGILSQKEIAAKLGISPQRLYRRKDLGAKPPRRGRTTVE